MSGIVPELRAEIERLHAELDQKPIAYVWTHHRTYGAPGEIQRKVIWCDEQGNDLDHVLEFYRNGGINGEGKTISIAPLFSRPVPSAPERLTPDGKYGQQHHYACGWNDAIDAMLQAKEES